jgi:hypothetical protein
MTEKELSTEVGQLTGLASNVVEHLIYLAYVCILHDITCNAIDTCDGKMKEAKFNVPFICDITLDLSDEYPVITDYTFKKDFLNKLRDSVYEGKDELEKEVRERFIERLKSNYNKLV